MRTSWAFENQLLANRFDSVIYLTQLLLRTIAILKTKFWKKLPWTFPAGQLSLEISLKVLEQESTTNGNTQSAGETGSRSVRGPVAEIRET